MFAQIGIIQTAIKIKKQGSIQKDKQAQWKNNTE